MLPFVRRFASSVSGPKAMILHTMEATFPMTRGIPMMSFPRNRLVSTGNGEKICATRDH